MRFVLDTHIWIWSLVDPTRLTPDVRSALADTDHELWLSSISVWEALVLIRKGRLKVRDTDDQTWIAEALGRAPLREAAITHAIAIASEQLELDHCDPADRFIAATAQVLEATLITADKRLIEFADISVLANR
jgi:PIN domain nuclease of toxin-antitoxin system